jgi:hypothetical protein
MRDDEWENRKEEREEEIGNRKEELGKRTVFWYF